MGEDASPELAVIVGCARSGTTLQRQLLNAHPEIACPAEAGLPGLISHMNTVWATMNADLSDESAATTDPGNGIAPPAGTLGGRESDAGGDSSAEEAVPIPTAPREWIRHSIRGAISPYCERHQRRLYVDKSIDSAQYLGFLNQLFPDARYILVFRHVMDTIASGIEASPWGFQAYGYGPYIQASPGNSVAALARYWLDHVSLALGWEARHPELCMRVRYEDFVVDPEPMVLGVQRFLGVTEDASVLSSAFEDAPSPGPGDHKIGHTTRVHAQSVGHGKRVPIDMLPPPLLEALNEKLVLLEYPPLDRSWNATERSVSRSADSIWRQRLQEVMANAIPPGQETGVGPFGLIAEDDRELRWVIDPASQRVTQGDGEVEAVLAGTTEDLVLALTGEENFGALIRGGRVRHVLAGDEQRPPAETWRELLLVVAALRSGAAAAASAREDDLVSVS